MSAGAGAGTDTKVPEKVVKAVTAAKVKKVAAISPLEVGLSEILTS